MRTIGGESGEALGGGDACVGGGFGHLPKTRMHQALSNAHEHFLRTCRRTLTRALTRMHLRTHSHAHTSDTTLTMVPSADCPTTFRLAILNKKKKDYELYPNSLKIVKSTRKISKITTLSKRKEVPNETVRA